MTAILDIHAREILNTRGRLNEIYTKHTGQELAAIEDAMDRDKFMSPEEAQDFGLIDHVVVSRPPALKDSGDGDEDSETGQK